MKVSEVMTRNVKVIHWDKNIYEAAQLMAKLDCGSIPVERGDKMVGMITDRDIAIRCVAEGADPNFMKVSEIMTEGIDWCYDDENIEDVAMKMATHQIRRVPVVNRAKRLVGMVSLGDVANKVNNAKLTHDVFSSIAHH